MLLISFSGEYQMPAPASTKILLIRKHSTEFSLRKKLIRFTSPPEHKIGVLKINSVQFHSNILFIIQGIQINSFFCLTYDYDCVLWFSNFATNSETYILYNWFFWKIKIAYTISIINILNKLLILLLLLCRAHWLFKFTSNYKILVNFIFS